MHSIGTFVAVAVPVGVYIGALFGIYLLLIRAWDGFYASAVLIALLVLGAAVGLASAGVSTPVCLLVVTAAPTVVIASFELLGHRRTADAVANSARSVIGRS